MNTETLINQRFQLIREFCEQNAEEKFILKYSRYFKTGYDAWGVDPTLLKIQLKKWLAEWRKDWQLADFMKLSDKLVASGKYEETSFAILFTAALKKQFTPEIFHQIGYWLENDIRNWAHTDCICSEIMKPLIVNKIISISDFEPWRNSPSSWQQRAVPVAFIQAVKSENEINHLLEIINPMMLTNIREVQQGLGWFLREAWKLHPTEAETFLFKWKNDCGRIIIQYATEKMRKEEKLIYKKEK